MFNVVLAVSLGAVPALASVERDWQLSEPLIVVQSWSGLVDAQRIDVDLDGRDDVVFVDDPVGGQVRWIKVGPDRQAQTEPVLLPGLEARGAIAHDSDGDGIRELFVCVRVGDTYAIRSFQPYPGGMVFDREWASGFRWGFSTWGIDDFDGDGDTDFIVADEGRTHALRAPDYTPDELIRIGYSLPQFLDIDGDGDLDVAVGDWGEWAQGTLTVYTLEGGRIRTTQSLRGHEIRGESFANLSGTGRLDAVGANPSSRDETLLAAQGSDGTFGPPRPWLGAGFALNALVDLDGDGDDDVIAFTRRGYNPVLLENEGGVLGPAVPGAVPGRVLNAFDLENDGDLDLIVAAGDGVRIAWNLGPGERPEPAPPPPGVEEPSGCTTGPAGGVPWLGVWVLLVGAVFGRRGR